MLTAWKPWWNCSCFSWHFKTSCTGLVKVFVCCWLWSSRFTSYVSYLIYSYLSCCLLLSLPPTQVCHPVHVYITSLAAVAWFIRLLCTMKILPFLVLLSSAVLLCSARLGSDPVTCTQEGIAAAAHLATFRINEHHHHGYKFRLNETEHSKIETVLEPGIWICYRYILKSWYLQFPFATSWAEILSYGFTLELLSLISL